MDKRAKKKKVDYYALNSPFMRIKGMSVAGARALLDLKFSEVYELRGRAPEVLLEELSKKRKSIKDEDYLKFFTLAVNWAEED